jgi:uncharacterized protein
MEMNFPLFKFEYFNDNISLVLAVIIGIGFGFFLERAGFGNARLLAAQFYFRDMRVFKVMFTAIVTAMLGVFYFSWIGWLDLSLVYLTPTYLLPQIAGGLILGIGFVIGGYCPGTSLVSMSTGRFDGLVYVIGIFLGIFIFGEMFWLFESFYYSSSMGELTIPQITNLPYGLIVFLVVLMALGGFFGAEKVEKHFAAKDAESMK